MANNIPRVKGQMLDALIRSNNFEEVSCGFSMEEAMLEASRCLLCKNPRCVAACPVNVQIPYFIACVREGKFEEAAHIISKDSCLPSICGRVCPHEDQCEGSCILGIKKEAVSIGLLERFVGDWSREHDIQLPSSAEKKHKKIAVIGSGPAGLSCANDLARWGYDVTIFEAFSKAGGVLEYGIPEFRLPKQSVLKHEIDVLLKLGVQIKTNQQVGQDITIDQLLTELNFSAIFIAAGAGVSKTLGIEGESLKGTLRASDFLLEVNDQNSSNSEYKDKQIAIIGGGNVAMDAARSAIRLGAKVTIVYRRTEVELPASKEEIHHCKQEGIVFKTLTNPVTILGNSAGCVNQLECMEMELGEPDESGRRSPKSIPNSHFLIDVDYVIMALGSSVDTLIADTTPGLELDKWNCIRIDSEGHTTRKGVFAGGDIVTGPATVIMAMGAGRKAAKAIDQYLS